MELHDIGYSTKNIPTPANTYYTRKLLEKVEDVVKCMRWKALTYDSLITDTHTDYHNIKTRRCPPSVKDLAPFEADLLDLVANITFRKYSNPCQNKLRADIKSFKASNSTFVFSDKTNNLYEVDNDRYNQLLTNNITNSYKQI